MSRIALPHLWDPIPLGTAAAAPELVALALGAVSLGAGVPTLLVRHWLLYWSSLLSIRLTEGSLNYERPRVRFW